MPSKTTSRLGAALLSALVTVAAYGCVGTPQARNPGSATNNAGFTNRGSAVAGPEGTAGNDGTGGIIGNPGNAGYRGANTGVGVWGANTARRVRTRTSTVGEAADLGRQISAAVARMDGVGGTNRAGFMGMGTTGAGGVTNGSVGVSTLVLDDIAYVGIRQTSGQTTTGNTTAGAAGTRTGLTGNRAGLGGNWNGLGGIGMTPGVEDGTIGTRRAGTLGAGTGIPGAAGTTDVTNPGGAAAPGTTAGAAPGRTGPTGTTAGTGTTAAPGTSTGTGTAGTPRTAAGTGAPRTPGTTIGTGTVGTNVGGGQRAATAGASLHDQIRARVKAMFPHVEEVYVTTDPDLVYRIARVTGDDNGMSVLEKINEMAAIARAMTPSTIGTGTGQTGGAR